MNISTVHWRGLSPRSCTLLWQSLSKYLHIMKMNKDANYYKLSMQVVLTTVLTVQERYALVRRNPICPETNSVRYLLYACWNIYPSLYLICYCRLKEVHCFHISTVSFQILGPISSRIQKIKARALSTAWLDWILCQLFLLSWIVEPCSCAAHRNGTIEILFTFHLGLQNVSK